MERRQNQTPQGQIARVLVEFLEVAITGVVFLKGFYPSGAFERRRYMNVVVQRARHPQLKNYIHATVAGLLPFVQKGMVERVAVIFFNADNVPLEKFVFKLAMNQAYGSEVEEVDLEFSLRSFLIKLSHSESLCKGLPPVHIHILEVAWNQVDVIVGGRLLLILDPYLRLVQAKKQTCGSQLTQNSGSSLHL